MNLVWPDGESLKLYDLAGAGDMGSFTDALSAASPEELAFLHPLSVRVTCCMSLYQI